MTDETLAIYGYQMDKEGLKDFFDAYVSAPNNADVAIRGGSVEGHPEVRLLVLTVDDPTIGATTVALSAEQARSFAGMLAEVAAKMPDAVDGMGLDRLEAGLRDAIRRLEYGNVH